MNDIEFQKLIFFLNACFLIWETLLLIPMVPGKLIDTRDFSELPRWQYNLFNVFLTSLGIASFVFAGFSLIEADWVFIPSLVLGCFYATVFYADLFKIFPVVKDSIPLQLLVLESIGLSSAGIMIVVSIKGILIV